MSKRGRPRHPDILTPREWEVLALLREGLSNDEIAQRLGISLAGAKYHVSEILGKLGVASREEAARWDPGQRPWWASAAAPVAWTWRKTNASWITGAIAAGIGFAVVAGIALLVWGLVRTSGDASSTADILPDPIVLGEGLYGGADWSPDGRSIAFVAAGGLYRADAPDFVVRQLLVEGGEYGTTIREPRWPPDGKRIAFLGEHQGRGERTDISTNTIWIVNADGSGLRDLLPGDAAILSVSTAKVMQGWLDNQTLAFDEHCGTGCQQPLLLNVESSEVVHTASLNDDSTGLNVFGTVYYYSPDQRWLAAQEVATIPTVRLYNRLTAELTRLAPDAPRMSPWQWFSSWAPDSSAFLYYDAESDGVRYIPPFTLRRFDVGTGQDQALATPGKAGVWSDDGSLIAYITAPTSGRPCDDGEGANACTAVMDAASGDELYRVPGPSALALESGGHDLPTPLFLPDGQLIHTTPEGSLGIADEGSASILFDADVIDLVVAPDGGSLIVAELSRLTLVSLPQP